jgi:hypothetical protein
MSQGNFQVVATNPNDDVGGGGCICDPLKNTDCQGPFVVIPGNDMDSPLSPHVVIGAKCIDLLHRAIQGDVLPGVDQQTYDTTAVEVVDDAPEL